MKVLERRGCKMRFSLCMIVKNEEAVLRDCLDSLKELMDEIIIVDTGSTDKTKEIAAEYTSNVYDFEWVNDFAAARNYAFSKATGDYIYSADADEYLDEENRVKFKALKKVLMPEVEIVQMIYVTEQINHPTENFVKDLRPKLFKRLREFTWIDPIHETINTSPIVFDSDIEVNEYLMTVEHDYPLFHITMHAYLCTLIEGELVLNEHNDSVWLNKEELSKVDWAEADMPIVSLITK